MNKLRRSLPSMNGLFTFEAAGRCGNFSKAADELNVTPAAVSRMIARLEEHLDTPLFLRRPGGVDMTESGQILFDAIARGFSGIENALREIEDRRSGLETVTLSVSTAFTTHWVMPRMAQFKEVFPDVELRFQLMMGPISGSVNDVDLGMRYADGPDARHDAVFIMPEILIPICTPSYLESHGLSGVGKRRAPMSTINLSDAQPDWSSFFTSAKKEEAENSMVFSDYAIVVQAALLGQGVALGWLNVVAHWLRTKALVPERHQVRVTDRKCQMLRLRDKPARSIVMKVQDWIVTELHKDMLAVDALYPELELDTKRWIVSGV
ncbi:MAG: LysR family transcriptional regulator [Alphaproteobacteria bacterium]|nr:LysR family transcriptional regulator [Alphaproteobacteria bacterium]